MEMQETIMNIDMKSSRAFFIAVAAYAGYRVAKGTFGMIGNIVEKIKEKGEEVQQAAEAAAKAEGA